MTESPFVDSGFAVPVFSPGDDPIACLNKAMAFLTAVASSRFPTTNNQLRTSSNPRNQATIQDGKARVVKCYNCQGEGRMARQCTQPKRQRNATCYKAKTVVPHNAAFQTKDLDTYDFDYDDLSTAQAVLMTNIYNYGFDVISEDFEQSTIMDFTDNEISSTTRFNDFILSAEKAFWFHTLNPTIEPSYTPPVIVDVASELPKVSLVNTSLKKLKFHLTQFDSVVKKRTTPSALEEGKWGFEHTKTVFNNEIIPFLKSLKDIFNVFDKDLLNEITKVQTVFDQMEASVQQFSVDKKCLEIAKKESLLENDRLLQKIMSQDVLIIVMNSTSLNNNSVNMEMLICESCDKCLHLDAEFSKSKQAYNALLKSHSQLEKHCISLEVSNQLNQEIFQKDEFKNIFHEKTNTIMPSLCIATNKDAHIGDYFEGTPQDKLEENYGELLVYVFRVTCPNAIKRAKNVVCRTQVKTMSMNGVVKRRNRTLVEAARTMLIFSKAPLFLWAEVINSTCYTKNRSLICHRYNKTPYKLMQDKKLDLSFLHVFGSLCYPTNDNEDLGKLDAKADIGIFVGYAPAKKAFRIYNKRTRIIIETIHVTFDELTDMASKQFSLGPRLHSMTPVTSSSGLVSNPVSQQPCIPPITFFGSLVYNLWGWVGGGWSRGYRRCSLHGFRGAEVVGDGRHGGGVPNMSRCFSYYCRRNRGGQEERTQEVGGVAWRYGGGRGPYVHGWVRSLVQFRDMGWGGVLFNFFGGEDGG
ncbi:retrovirus-related pol polyprotein from transposon TNT 1-94 [Tanacetum coccineum]